MELVFELSISSKCPDYSLCQLKIQCFLTILMPVCIKTNLHIKELCTAITSYKNYLVSQSIALLILLTQYFLALFCSFHSIINYYVLTYSSGILAVSMNKFVTILNFCVSFELSKQTIFHRVSRKSKISFLIFDSIEFINSLFNASQIFFHYNLNTASSNILFASIGSFSFNSFQASI